MTDPAAQAVHRFWFEEIGADRWWVRSEETDRAIRARFHTLWEERRDWPAGRFLGSPGEAIAAVILFDQFPRNMFRGSAHAFASDALARTIADLAIERGFEAALSRDERWFLYLPFMHSETLADQDRCVALFEALGNGQALDYAHKHRAVIARFGRFPHRNAALGREHRPGEAEAAQEGAGW